MNSVLERYPSSKCSPSERESSKKVLSVLAKVSNDKGVGLLPAICRLPNSTQLCNIILSRASQYSLEELKYLLHSKEKESGYNAMHTSVLNRDLCNLLLIMKYCGCKNYSDILLEDSLLVSDVLNDKDKEGFTPAALLSVTLEKDVVQAKHFIEAYFNNTSKTNTIAYSEQDIHEEDDDINEDNADLMPLSYDDHNNINNSSAHFDVLNQTNKNSSHSLLPKYACEVLTFGRADHCALGVPQYATSTSNTTTNNNSSTTTDSFDSSKPKRIKSFALNSTYTQNNTAISIAAAAHHTLVLTSSGQIYSFGLGKGGRLGINSQSNRPLPTLITSNSLQNKKVVSIAAALNHSLCSTSNGAVYAWGSNRFGQLGYKYTPKQQNSNSYNISLSPKKVEDLKKVFVKSVAAADRHSVALTSKGEVYTWGDDRSAQLGHAAKFYHSSSSSVGGSSSNNNSNSSNTATSSYTGKPMRVNALWNNLSSSVSSSTTSSQPKVVIKIAAAEYSTLVLVSPPPSHPVNTVYGWGHGNSIPTKVHFPSPSFSNSKEKLKRNTPMQNTAIVNPIDIDCARYHNAAVTADGFVYTWGLHSGPLGTSNSSSSSGISSSSSSLSCMVATQPQLVTSLLATPSNSNSKNNNTSKKSTTTTIKATSISTSENCTAILTKSGHLYTWGATYGNDVLGHGGVRFQPNPRKVSGVCRAVSVASAKEHTVLLVATKFPDKSVLEEDGEVERSLSEEILEEGKRNHNALRDENDDDSDTDNDDDDNENHVDDDEENQDRVEQNEADDDNEEEEEVSESDNSTTTSNQPPTDTTTQQKTPPTPKFPTLQTLTIHTITNHIDMYNVLPILITAKRLHNNPLIRYCTAFIQNNLDGVLTWSKKHDLETLLENELICNRGILNTLNEEVKEVEGDGKDDGRLHPLILQFASLAGDGTAKHTLAKYYSPSSMQRKREKSWMEYCPEFLRSVPPAAFHNEQDGADSSLLSRYDSAISDTSAHNQQQQQAYEVVPQEKWSQQLLKLNISSSVLYSSSKLGKIASCSGKCYATILSLIQQTSSSNCADEIEVLLKEIRNVKKKLGRVVELEAKITKKDETFDSSSSSYSKDEEKQKEGEEASSLTEEQIRKMARKPIYEADLAILSALLEMMRQRRDSFEEEEKEKEKGVLSAAAAAPINTEEEIIEAKISSKPHPSGKKPLNDEDTTNQKINSKEIKYRCKVCNVTCPDENSYTLHMSGRKHRNKIKQVEDNEQKETAAAIMMEMKRKQMMKDDNASVSSSSSSSSVVNHKMDIQPKYTLSPPEKYPSPSARKGGRTRSCSWGNHHLEKKVAAATTISLQQDGKKKKALVANSPSTGKKITSFQKILQEEERKAAAAASRSSVGAARKVPVSSPLLQSKKIPMVATAAKQSPSVAASSSSSPWKPPVTTAKAMPQSPLAMKAAPSLKTPPPLSLASTSSSPFAAPPAKQSSRKGQGKKKMSLGAFLEPAPSKQIVKGSGSGGGVAWASAKSPPATSSPSVAGAASSLQREPFTLSTTTSSSMKASSSIATIAHTTTPRKKTLHEIQQEEQEFKKREDTVCTLTNEGKWYLGRRERADSIGAIQEQEEKDREMRLLIEEQRQIEEQIAKELQQQQQQKQKASEKESGRKGKEKNGKNRKPRKKGGQQQQHQQQTGGGGEGDVFTQKKRGDAKKEDTDKDQEEKKQRPPKKHQRSNNYKKKSKRDNNNQDGSKVSSCQSPCDNNGEKKKL